MIAESLSEGLLDHEEHTRLTRALRIRTRLVADVAVPLVNIRAVQVSAVGSGPTIGGVEQALAQTGYSAFRWWIAVEGSSDICTSRTC